MTAAFTLCIPHKRNPGNDLAFQLCIACLLANTVNEFRLLVDTNTKDSIYTRVNRMVKQADTDCCVYLASDTFVARQWDAPMLALWDVNTIVTGVIVEPGAIGIHSDNVLADFGRKPETFRRDAFEAWANVQTTLPNGRGWPGCYMFSRQAFMVAGGLDTTMDGEFTPADMRFWDAWEARGGAIKRAKSYAYHLQRFSDEAEQKHEKRNIN